VVSIHHLSGTRGADTNIEENGRLLLMIAVFCVFSGSIVSIFPLPTISEVSPLFRENSPSWPLGSSLCSDYFDPLKCHINSDDKLFGFDGWFYFPLTGWLLMSRMWNMVMRNWKIVGLQELGGDEKRRRQSVKTIMFGLATA